MMEKNPELVFKSGYTNADDFESEMKGYRNDVFVKMESGDLYEVFFYDPIRLAQDMGNGTYLSHPGLIILNVVNRSSMEHAVNDLWKRGFFEYFKPRSSVLNKHFDENI